MFDGFWVECANQFCHYHVLCSVHTVSQGKLRKGEGQITQAWVTRTKPTSKTCIVLTLKKIKHGDAKVSFHKPQTRPKCGWATSKAPCHFRWCHFATSEKYTRSHQRILHTSSTKSSVVTFRRAPCHSKKRWGDSTVEVAVRYQQDKRTPLRLLVSTSTLILHKTRSKC